MEQFEEKNRVVAEKYFRRENLFSQKTEDKTKWKKNDNLRYRDTVLFFGMAMLKQREEMQLLIKEKKELEERVSRLEHEGGLLRKIKRKLMSLYM